jgi:hypothetical protein
MVGIGGPTPNPLPRGAGGGRKTNADLTQGGSHFAPLPWANSLLPLRGVGREETDFKMGTESRVRMRVRSQSPVVTV